MARFAFVEYKGPGQTSQPGRKTVRAHAARNVAARRQRVEQYQLQKKSQLLAERQKQPEQQDRAEDAADVDREQWSTPWMIPEMGTAVAFLQRNPQPLDVLGAARTDPLQSFSREMSPMDHFLLDHFANCMIWCAIEHYVVCTAQQQNVWGTRIASHWIRMAANDPGILSAILAAACRHIDMKSGTNTHDHLALVYQSQVVANLRQALNVEAEAPSDATIVKTMCLATEAATLYNTAVAMNHTAAALRMYELQDSSTGSSITGATMAPPRPTGDADLDCEYACPDHFQDRKKLILLYDLKSTELRRREVKWRNARLDEACFMYTQFMLSRISLS